jgi:hypothetical protein
MEITTKTSERVRGIDMEKIKTHLSLSRAIEWSRRQEREVYIFKSNVLVAFHSPLYGLEYIN